MKARLTFILLAWLAAFIVVLALFVAFGGTLEELPLPLRALVISGMLTLAMTQFAIPLISRFSGRGAGSVPDGGMCGTGADVAAIVI